MPPDRLTREPAERAGVHTGRRPSFLFPLRARAMAAHLGP